MASASRWGGGLGVWAALLLAGATAGAQEFGTPTGADGSTGLTLRPVQATSPAVDDLQAGLKSFENGSSAGAVNSPLPRLARATTAVPPAPPADPVQQRLDALEKQNADLARKLEQLQAKPAAKVEEKEPGAEAPKGEKADKGAGEKDKAAPKEWEVGKSLKMEGAWKNALWFETPDKAFRWAVGGVIQFDTSYFQANQDVVNSLGRFNNLGDPGRSLDDSWAFRRARLRFSGTMWEQVEFFAQYEFAQALDLRRRTLGIDQTGSTLTNNEFDPGDNVGFNEVYLGLVKIPLLGQVRVGRHRESLNFVTATPDNNQVWLERGLLFDAFNGDFNFSNGVTVQNTYLDDRVYTLFGMFHANNNTNRGFYAVGDGEYAYDGRLTCLPYHCEEEEFWVHVGADYSYRNPHASQLRYRARPMVRSGPAFLTPNLVSTGTIFTPDAQQIANLEFAMARGRFTFAAEAAASWVTNAFTGGLPQADGTLPEGVRSRGTYVAQGAYVEALYFLTPDHRKYRKDRPGYDRVVPRVPFYLIEGRNGTIFSRGGWEIGARYDYLDLIHNGINGGQSNAVTLALNWYWNPNTRIQLNYSWMTRDFAPEDTAGRVHGDVQALGVRFNTDF